MVTWEAYEFGIRFRDTVVGGIPVIGAGANPAEVIEAWARGQGVEEPAKLAEDLEADPDHPVTTEEIEGLRTGFKRDEVGIYVECRQVKAMIRESSQRLGYIKKVVGMRQVIQHDVIVRPPGGSRAQKLYLHRDGVPLTEPDGIASRAISVVTRQGPRTAIKSFEYVECGELAFEVRILASGIAKGTLDEEKLLDVIAFGEEIGIGADRSQGCGTFETTAYIPQGRVETPFMVVPAEPVTAA